MGTRLRAGKQAGLRSSGRGPIVPHPIRVLGRTPMTAAPPLPLIAVLNGPNLNMLGLRQPETYGTATLDDVEALCAETAEQLGIAIDFRQTNGEGELVTWVQEFRGRAAGIVINPAGYSHTSIALMDAVLAVSLPVIEVHISNIHKREDFRQHSYVSKAAVGVIAGLGILGYGLALRAMAELIQEGP
jgi:3-dehydroquinate dehydratase-2